MLDLLRLCTLSSVDRLASDGSRVASLIGIRRCVASSTPFRRSVALVFALAATASVRDADRVASHRDAGSAAVSSVRSSSSTAFSSPSSDRRRQCPASAFDVPSASSAARLRSTRRRISLRRTASPIVRRLQTVASTRRRSPSRSAALRLLVSIDVDRCDRRSIVRCRSRRADVARLARRCRRRLARDGRRTPVAARRRASSVNARSPTAASPETSSRYSFGS